MIVIGLFFLLLVLGVPIAFIVLMAATGGVAVYTATPMIVVIQQMYAGLNSFVLIAIPLFVVAGSIASGGKTATYLVDVMNILFGKLLGGPVVAVVAACAFFAAISGSAVATVVAIGGVMIPGLIKSGYSERTAIGVIGSAGTLGVLIPPSGPMVLFAVALGCSVGKLFIAGFLPGVLLAAVWAAYAVFTSRKSERVQPRRYSMGESARILVRAFPALLFPVIVLGSIYSGWATPTEAAAISVLYVLVVELFFYRTLRIRDIPQTVFKALIMSSTITIIMSTSGVLTWFVTTMNIPHLISTWIVTNISSKFVFLLLFNVIMLVAGMFMGLVALIVVICPILLPCLQFFQIDLIHFAIICVMNAQIGFLTPPFGTNLFVTMNVAKRPFGEVVRATLPYTVILLLMTLLITYVPELSLWLPRLLR